MSILHGNIYRSNSTSLFRPYRGCIDATNNHWSHSVKVCRWQVETSYLFQTSFQRKLLSCCLQYHRNDDAMSCCKINRSWWLSFHWKSSQNNPDRSNSQKTLSKLFFIIHIHGEIALTWPFVFNTLRPEHNWCYLAGGLSPKDCFPIHFQKIVIFIYQYTILLLNWGWIDI